MSAVLGSPALDPRSRSPADEPRTAGREVGPGAALPGWAPEGSYGCPGLRLPRQPGYQDLQGVERPAEITGVKALQVAEYLLGRRDHARPEPAFRVA